MDLALNLARERVGLTGDNPSVGCVIVKNDIIIAIGQTGIGGRPHAEYNAIKSYNKNFKGSKMYVTLEPCAHYGKTPPCSNIIINSKIKEVIFPLEDIDKRTSGKSKQTFVSKKIKVRIGLLKKKAKDIYKPYFYNRKKKLPFVTGKLAVSKDKFISSINKIRITNSDSDNFSQLLRYKNDAILISSKTLNKDNPKLNCRLHGLENFSPKRVIIDRNLLIKKKLYLLKNIKSNNTIIFHKKINKNKINQLKKKGVKLIRINSSKKDFFDLKFILKKLYFLGCRSLLIEGGKLLTRNFVKEKFFNQFYLFQGSKKLNKKGKLNVSSELHLLSFKYKNKSKINSYTGDDIVHLYSK